jgi:uncharacterized protein (TIGR02646 family)
MIKLTRLRTEAEIPASFRGAGRKSTEAKLLAARHDHLIRLKADPKASHNFPSTWWKSAKATLRKESGGKCAYCEARADAVAHCDVEHIRPKSEWWWLTCCWDNYCFSCQICNQKYKSDFYPISGRRTTGPNVRVSTSAAALAKLAGTLAPDPLDLPGIDKFAKAIAREVAGLPDPYFENPEAFFAWEVRPASGHVVMVARTSAPRSREMLAAVEKYYGVNREELKELRFELYESLEMVYQSLQTPNVPLAHRTALEGKLRNYLQGNRAFTAMCRYFICDVWQLLPRPS